MNILITLMLAVSCSMRVMSADETAIIESNMDQMSYTLHPESVKVTEMYTNGRTYCGRINATRKNGTIMEGYKIYGTWFDGDVVAPIALGVSARRLCTIDNFP